MSTNDVRVKAECHACGGTGIYSGFAEPKGVGVVCLRCSGTGCIEMSYKPFVSRKRRNGIHHVKLSAGDFIATGIGPTGGRISYDDFVNGNMPKK